jgi:hypothetical protein
MAKSSTPSTVIGPTGGSGSPRISRSSVCRLVGRPNSRASRVPARPASADPIAVSIVVDWFARRDCFRVRPSICSANVFAAHVMFGQKNLRTVSCTTTECPAIGASANRRR